MSNRWRPAMPATDAAQAKAMADHGVRWEGGKLVPVERVKRKPCGTSTGAALAEPSRYAGLAGAELCQTCGHPRFAHEDHADACVRRGCECVAFAVGFPRHAQNGKAHT